MILKKKLFFITFDSLESKERQNWLKRGKYQTLKNQQQQKQQVFKQQILQTTNFVSCFRNISFVFVTQCCIVCYMYSSSFIQTSIQSKILKIVEEES